MTTTTRRSAVVALVCLAQLLVVGVAVSPRLSARILGEEYRVAVRPVDPIDPFRGAYVTLDYPTITAAHTEPAWEDGATVYIPLVPDTAPDGAGDALWRGVEPVTTRPVSGPYVECETDWGSLRCGIDSLFASQERAKELERVLAGGAVAVLRVDARGNAAVVAIEPGA